MLISFGCFESEKKGALKMPENKGYGSRRDYVGTDEPFLLRDRHPPAVIQTGVFLCSLTTDVIFGLLGSKLGSPFSPWFVMLSTKKSQNYRMFWVGRNLNAHPAVCWLPTSAHGPIWPGLRCFQGWEIHTESRGSVFSLH